MESIRPLRTETRTESVPKKRRTSTSKMERYSSSNGYIDFQRKTSVQPTTKKRSKFESPHQGSLNKILKNTIERSQNRISSVDRTEIEDPQVKKMIACYKARDYSEAIALGRNILADNPDCLDALYIVGLSASMLDRHDLTIKYFESLLKLQPLYKKNVYLFLSIGYKKTANIEKSFEILNRALRLYPKFFEAFVSSA